MREERIAGRIREARRRAGLSQEKAAHRLYVTGRTYSRWERAETFGFLGHIPAIAKVLGTTPEELLGDDDIDTPTVEELSLKLDAVMEELRAMREELQRPKGKAARA